MIRNFNFMEVLFVLKLVIPAYYMENGFFSTWDGERGTLNSGNDMTRGEKDPRGLLHSGAPRSISVSTGRILIISNQ